MKLKRFAVRGLITLMVAVALCMFFAGTVRTIVTPKIKIVTPKYGKLEQSVTLKGKLTYPETEDLIIDKARGHSLTVERVAVSAGYPVKAGDLLFTTQMGDFEEKREKLRADYDEKIKKLDDLDVSNREHKRTNQRNTAYEAMLTAQKYQLDRKVALAALCEEENVKLLGTPVALKDFEDSAKDQGASEALLVVTRAYVQARENTLRVENQFFAMLDDKKTKGKDGVYDYLKNRAVLVAEIDQVEKDMIELTVKRRQLSEIFAPHDGYVVSVNIKTGDTYDGKTAAMVVNKLGFDPVLRADVSEVRQVIDEGATVTIKGEYDYWTCESKVTGVGMNKEGKRYVDVEINDDVTNTIGTVYKMSLSDTDMTVTSRAASSTSLIPASAVRSEGENENYVFVIHNRYGGFAGERMEVEKMNVTVLARSGKVVSVAEEMQNFRLADQEDRSIDDGSTVMEYVT